MDKKYIAYGLLFLNVILQIASLPGPMLKVIGFVTAFAIAAVIRVLLSRLFG